MSTTDSAARPESIATGARPPTDAERASMMRIVGLFDEAMGQNDDAAVRRLFGADPVCEVKPLGLRIETLDTIIEMFRRALPELSVSFSTRALSQLWANQNGIVREWLYPVCLASGQEVWTRQLEIIEFTSDLDAIVSYRLRMNLLYSKFFEQALGENFVLLPGIKRIPR